MVENKQIDICKELGQNFIDFSYEANSARAFADARDGLKPGQRACLWEMFDKGYLSSKPHVKSAKIAGAVAGTWWPHGNVAIYETFARMSQSWINNNPEVDWHGNNGSLFTGPECASDRYTEARLSKLAEEGLFNGIKKKNVNMILNFSEDAEWPEVLPAIFPRLMVNGCQGIGSTIANVWLPHNLKEIASVLCKYIDTNEIDYNNLYPSFPTGGIIINKNDIHSIYETGKGKVILRGKTEIKNDKILITELPYQVYVQPYVEKITEMAIKGDLVGIDAINNKSGKNKLLIEIECSGDPNKILSQLYLKTDLQKNYNANQWALIGKTPKLLTLKDYCEVYVKHNTECICHEAQFDLEKAGDRVHILNGLLKALEDIDNIITLIKKSENVAAAKDKLIEKYQFTEAQAKAILAMRLSSLASLEKIELQNEKAELDKKMDKLNALLANEDLQKIEIKNRLNTLVKKYGDDRRTELTQIEVSNEDKEIATITPEDVIVVMSKNGEIKKIPKASFKVQKRNTKGVKAEGDVILATLSTNTIDNLLLFTDKGQMYRTLVDNIPNGTNTSKGGRITDLINLQPSEKVIAMTSLERKNDKKYVVFITKKGLIKKTLLEEYTKTKRNTGIQAIKIKDGDSIANIEIMNEEDMLITTKNGQAIHFETKNIAAIGRVTCGVKAITLKNNDEVLNGIVVKDNDEIAFFSEGGYGKKVNLNEFPKQNRGGIGVTTLKEGNLIGATVIKNNDNLLLIGNTSICIAATEVPLLSRIAIGNIMIKTKNLKSIVKI